MYFDLIYIFCFVSVFLLVVFGAVDLLFFEWFLFDLWVLIDFCMGLMILLLSSFWLVFCFFVL